MDAVTIWTAVAAIAAALGPVGAVFHLSGKIEKRFATMEKSLAVLEVHGEYTRRAIESMPKRHEDIKS